MALNWMTCRVKPDDSPLIEQRSYTVEVSPDGSAAGANSTRLVFDSLDHLDQWVNALSYELLRLQGTEADGSKEAA